MVQDVSVWYSLDGILTLPFYSAHHKGMYKGLIASGYLFEFSILGGMDSISEYALRVTFPNNAKAVFFTTAPSLFDLAVETLELCRLHLLLDRGHNNHYIEMVTGFDHKRIDEKRSLLKKGVADAEGRKA